MKKIFPVMLLLILLVAGCSGGGAQTEQYESENSINNQGIESIYVDREPDLLPSDVAKDSIMESRLPTVSEAMLVFGGTDEATGELIHADGGAYVIETRRYYVDDESRENKIEIFYPKLIKADGGDRVSFYAETVNEMIREAAFYNIIHGAASEFHNRFEIYIEHEIMYSSNTFLSIRFSSSIYRYSTPSNNYCYTLNLDLVFPLDNLRLRDFFIIDDEFVDVFKNKPVFDDEKGLESQYIFEHYILDVEREWYSNERLKRDLFTADGGEFGPGNSCYSYFTSDSVGITMHFNRHYVILELKYEDLVSNIRHDNPLWDELLAVN